MDDPARESVGRSGVPTGRRRAGWLRRLTAQWVLLGACAGLGGILGLGAQGAEGAPEMGRAQITFAGQPAPPPSSAVCGLVLVAGGPGPQAAISEKPATAAVSLGPRERLEISIPIRGLTGAVTASAEASCLEPGEAEVTLELGDARSGQRLSNRNATVLSLTAASAGTETILRLRTGAGTDPAAVRWRRVCLRSGGWQVEVPLWPGSGNVDVCPAPVLPPLHKAIEGALIEWDWRMQDGVGTERAASTCGEASERTFQRAEALLRDLHAAGTDLGDQPARWRNLRERQKQLATAPPDGNEWEELWRQVHRARRELVFSNPLARTGPLAFVKQAPSIFSHQLTQYYGSCARPGGGIFVLEAPGQSMACRTLVAEALPPGSFQHLEVSPDGHRLLFAYCEAPTVPKDREEHLERFYHLYEARRDGPGLRRLTEGPYDDFSPRYLPDGNLLFVSTRRGGFHRCGRGPCAVYTLTVAEPDGSHPRPISFHETHEWDPAVLHDGRVVYTRWDYVDRHAVYYEQLWTVRPDGTDVRAFYGNNTFNPVGVWEARPVPGSRRIMATAGAHHAMTAGSIILVDPTRGVDGPDPISRLTPDALFPESEAPVILKPNGVWSAPAGVDRPPVAPPEAVRWPGHCYRSPYPLSEKYFLAAYSFDALIGEPTWNPANMFGLYWVDAFGNKELLYRDFNIASLWPVPLRPAPVPVQTASVRDPGLGGAGTFFVQDVYASWPAVPRQSVKRLRIVQVLPKTTPHANTPMVGLANASPGKQVLGTVPVEPDGSAYFRAPAGVPLAFQALDERGRAVQIMRSLTYLQPGERASCVGCHEHRSMAPSSAQPRALALAREPSRIAPGPDGSNPFSYPLLVQPVLDRKCVRCHCPAKPDGNILLTGDPRGAYTTSYLALAPRVPFSAWGGKDGDFRQVNAEPLSRPGFFGARRCKLMDLLFAGHYQTELEEAEVDRLVTWMDVNALFYGTFDPEDQRRQQLGERIAGPKLQ